MSALPSVTKTAQSDEWYTPPAVIEAAVAVLGAIDLDPAWHPACHVRPAAHFTREEDGLAQEWAGRVWCNPPWSGTAEWARKLFAELDCGRVTAAIFCCRALGLETRWWQEAFRREALVCFPGRRLDYTRGDGRQGSGGTQGSALLYFGPEPDRFRAVFGPLGVVVQCVAGQG